MLVLGTLNPDKEFVLRQGGEVIARIRTLRNVNGSVRQIGFICDRNILISREPIPEKGCKT